MVFLKPRCGSSSGTYSYFQYSKNLSFIPPLALAYEYGITKSGVNPIFIFPSQVVSHPARFAMPPLSASTIMSYEDQKRFKSLTCLDPPRFSGVIGKDAYEFFIDYREKL